MRMRWWAAMAAALSAVAVAAEDKQDDVSTVYITDEISGYMATQVDGQVAEAKKQKAKRILVVIDSPGGSVLAGLQIIRSLRASDIPTVCRAEGLAASMAFIILQSPACGERVIRPHTIVMAHSVAVGGGSVDVLREARVRGSVPVYVGAIHERDAEQIRRALHAIDLSIASMIAPRIGMTPADYMRWIYADDQWHVGEDALAMKMADRVEPIIPAGR